MNIYSIPVLNLESLTDNNLILQAAKTGIFYIEIPENCRGHIRDAIDFSYGFSKNEKIKEYSDSKFGGYHDRKDAQIESFYVEKVDWNKILPPSLEQLAEKMHSLSISVLKALLTSAGLPNELWGAATGQLTENRGQYHASYNHYRKEKEKVGINEHCDFGFASFLYTEKPGLEALIDKEWVDVPPIENHFVGIMGKAGHLLLPHKVTAACHRVQQLSKKRISFAMTCDNKGDSPVLRYNEDKNCFETIYSSYDEYLELSFNALYGKTE